MQVRVTFRNTETNDGVKMHAEEKAEKIKKLMRSPIQVNFIFSKDKKGHFTELTVSGDGAHLSSSVSTNDYFAGVDESVHKILTQLKKFKDKTESKKVRTKIPRV